MSLMHREQMDCCNYFEATGNEITIDSKSNWMQLESIEGNTTQLQTTGAQLFDANKIPSKSQGGATVVNNDDGSFTITGTGVLTETFYSEHIYSKDKTLQVLKPGKYNISKSDVYPRCTFLLLGTGLNKEITSQTAIPIEITAEDLMVNDVHVIISIYGNKNSTIKPGTIKPMVWMKEAIPTDSDWEPYTGGKPSPSPDYPQEIVNADIKSVTIKSAQMFDINNPSSALGQWIIAGNKISITNPTSGYLSLNYNINVMPNTLYTFYSIIFNDTPNVESMHVSISLLKEDGTIIKDNVVILNNTSSGKFTTTEDTKSINIYFRNRTTSNGGYFKDIVLNKGSSVIPWQPYYNPQTISLTFTEPFRKVGDYADEITPTKKVSRCIEITLDGSENWSVSSSDKRFQLSGNLPVPMNRRAGFCNQYFVRTKRIENEPQLWLGIDNNDFIYIPYNQFYDESLEDKGLSLWKAHLATNPLKIITYTNPEDYVETPLDQSNVDAIKSLYAYNGVTIVNNNENTNMKIMYKTKS
ncbi:hypothetical protein CB473P2_00049 [Enterocloster phage CB473P2]|nr:hypothetical protein CB457P2_00049 [Enterocloster phage CB457P2]WAX11336.1 hypothetical protein CB473P1_00049 [Enterocloster phage CB473P1]WAX11469.1 hypothetical protein CB473P2_00049 [Enterocloster phage CB473P2]